MSEPRDPGDQPVRDEAPPLEADFQTEDSLRIAPPTAQPCSPIADTVGKSQGIVDEPKSEHDSTPEEAKRLLNDESRRLNQYVLVVQLGAGGMGSVWKAWDTKLTRWVAVKFLSSPDPTGVKRFQREAQTAGRLHHPNICGVHEVNEVNRLHFLVMDYIEGTSIDKAKLSLPEMLGAFAKVCRAVDYAHEQKIIHRDIKPANIMVSKKGEPVVTDFGLAKVLQTESSLSATGAVLGTPTYMPPEQALGQLDDLDARSDIYSLGATLYVLATGRAPFQGENITQVLYKVSNEEPIPPRQANPGLPAPVEAIILKAMEKDKLRRYATAEEMAKDLECFLTAQPVSAKAPGTIEHAVKRIRKNPARYVAAAAVLVAVGAIVALAVRRGERKQGNYAADPAEGLLELHVRPEGAQFTLMPLAGAGEKRQGTAAPGALRLPAERYGLRIWKNGYLPHWSEVHVVQEKPAVLEVDLRPMEIWSYREREVLTVHVTQDLTGDGAADLLVVLPFQWCYCSGADGTWYSYGPADVDGKDGCVRVYSDFLIGTRDNHSLDLRAFSGTRPAQVFHAQSDGTELPDVVPGDLDGDGVADWAWTSGALLRAVSGKNRKTLWQAVQKYDATMIFCQASDLDGDGSGDLVCGDARGNLTVRSGRDGSVLFETEKVNVVSILPDVNGDGRSDILASDAATTFALSGADPQARLWQVPGRLLPHRGPLFDLDGDGIVDVLVRSGSTVTAFSGRDARKLWNSADFQDGDVLVGSEGSTLLVGGKRAAALSAKSGSLLWEARAGGEVCGTSDLTGDSICDLVATAGSRLVLISGKDGSTVWEYDAGLPIRFWGAGDFDRDGKADCVATTKDGLRALRAR